MKTIARELFEYLGVSGGFKDGLASAMQNIFGIDPDKTENND